MRSAAVAGASALAVAMRPAAARTFSARRVGAKLRVGGMSTRPRDCPALLQQMVKKAETRGREAGRCSLERRSCTPSARLAGHLVKISDDETFEMLDCTKYKSARASV